MSLYRGTNEIGRRIGKGLCCSCRGRRSQVCPRFSRGPRCRFRSTCDRAADGPRPGMGTKFVDCQNAPASGMTAQSPVRASDMMSAFTRDRFTCRYEHCRRRTIYAPVLKHLSRMLPDILPYQKNWRPVEDHILYWTWSTSLEHKVSFPFGGTSAPDNLITSCYQCNDLKNILPYEDLGW